MKIHKEFRAVLFDMDGVIVNTEPLHRKAYYKMFQEQGIEVSEELYTSFTGASTLRVCSRLRSEFNLAMEVEELMRIKRKHFKYLFENDDSFDLIPGVLDLIKNYYANNIRMVLASSASNNTINWVFEKFKLHPYFVGKISGTDLKESKPNPEIFLKAATIAETPIEKCFVIEDSTNGIRAAYEAGIFCVAYKSAHSNLQNYEKAQMLIDDFSEIMIF